MKVCYRKSDGMYCDSQQSWPAGYPGDEEFVRGPNVMGRFGGSPEDYVIIETDEPEPWFKRLAGGDLVDDAGKRESFLEERRQRAALRRRIAELEEKVRADAASFEELRELVGRKLAGG